MNFWQRIRNIWWAIYFLWKVFFVYCQFVSANFRVDMYHDKYNRPVTTTRYLWLSWILIRKTLLVFVYENSFPAIYKKIYAPLSFQKTLNINVIICNAIQYTNSVRWFRLSVRPAGRPSVDLITRKPLGSYELNLELPLTKIYTTPPLLPGRVQ